MEIKLEGSKKYITGNPSKYIHVESGTVYVYVTCTQGKVAGRSLFVVSREEGENIPALSVSLNKGGAIYQFLLIARDSAVISVINAGDKKEDIRREFIEAAGMSTENEKDFNLAFINLYRNTLIKEKRIIERKRIEQGKVREGKISLMGSLFRRRDKLKDEGDTESPLYNAFSVYCGYLGINLCSYQSLRSSYGDDFTVHDLARLSHFVVRKVKLEKNWYKTYEEPLMAFRSENHDPVICIPYKRGKYVMYGINDKTDSIVGEKEASTLEAYAIIAYEHLPFKSLKLKEVMEYGIRHINRTDMISYGIMYVFTTLVGLLIPFLNEMFYDRLIPLGSMGPVREVGLVMLSVMIGNVFFTLVQNLASYRGIKKMEYSVMQATYDRVFRLPQRFIESFGTMELIGRINAVPTVFSSTVSSGITAFTGMLLSIFYLWKMFDKSRVLAFRGLVVTVLSGIIMYFFGRLRIRPEKEKLERATDANAILHRLVSGILKIKVSGIENRGLYEFQKQNVRALEQDIKSTRINNIGNAISTVMGMLYTGVIYYTFVKKRQELSLGEYSSFSAAYGMFTSALNQLISFFLTWANLIPVMDRVRPIFEQAVENNDASNVPGKLSGRIEVDHLDFAYEDENEQILKDITFNVRPGEYIGIVGPSGCGKSTLLKCLLGFEKATKGKIYYDDKDIDTMDKCDLRRHMGVVMQDGQLVMGNILTNITLSSPEMDVDEVEEILKDVGLYDDVQQMPMGIFTNVSEGGGTVSGGQKQRILIARALANDPKIIMFDEATSALDNVTQAIVCDTLAKRNMTRIMIAHRLSTVRGCDRILVMDGGRIVETGNFEELMEQKGMFYELAKRQMVS